MEISTGLLASPKQRSVPTPGPFSCTGYPVGAQCSKPLDMRDNYTHPVGPSLRGTVILVLGVLNDQSRSYGRKFVVPANQLASRF